MADPKPHGMSFYGVGPRFVLWSVVFSAAGIACKVTWPDLFAISFLPRALTLGLGIALLAVGIPFAVAAIRALVRGFPTGKLFTGGVYATCRHPVYGVWVVFNVPGIILIADSWAGFVVALAMYVTLRILVREEEQALERAFGEEYLRYRRRTPAVLPLLWRLFSPRPER